MLIIINNFSLSFYIKPLLLQQLKIYSNNKLIYRLRSCLFLAPVLWFLPLNLLCPLLSQQEDLVVVVEWTKVLVGEDSMASREASLNMEDIVEQYFLDMYHNCLTIYPFLLCSLFGMRILVH